MEKYLKKLGRNVLSGILFAVCYNFVICDDMKVLNTIRVFVVYIVVRYIIDGVVLLFHKVLDHKKSND